MNSGLLKYDVLRAISRTHDDIGEVFFAVVTSSNGRRARRSRWNGENGNNQGLGTRIRNNGLRLQLQRTNGLQGNVDKTSEDLIELHRFFFLSFVLILFI